MTPWEPKDNEEETLWLFTIKEFQELPDGTELESIMKDKVVKGKDYIDMDTRGGHIAYGIKGIKTHPLAKLFVKFLLATKRG